jgi:Fe-S-cluster containining protein
MAEGPLLSTLDAAATLSAEADREIEARLKALAVEGVQPTCRAGCDACCRQLVVVSPLEAHAISAYVAADRELSQAVAGRVAEWEARVEALPELRSGLDRLGEFDGYLPDNEGDALEALYWKAQLPCPFLRERECSIYPARPFACREHYVVSDPALCQVEVDAPMRAGTRFEYRAIGNWMGSHALGLPDRQIVLPEATNYVEAHPEEPTRQATASAVRLSLIDGRTRVRNALRAMGLG